RSSRRSLLTNQAHDSIGGCSQDEVHRQMLGRYATATELADQTTERVLERLAGLSPARTPPWDTTLDLAVFNPSPHPRRDVVRVPLDGFPLYRITYANVDVHPLSMASGTVEGYEADGRPVRLVTSDDPGRVRMVEDWPAVDVELVVEDVPAFGWRRVRLAPSEPHHDEVDDGATIDDGNGFEVHVTDDGTLSISDAGRRFEGLTAVEDLGDRGDTYDFDPVDGDPGATLRQVQVERRRHPSGIQRLVVSRTFAVPACVEPSRTRRSDELVALTIRTEVRVAPGVGRADLRVTVDNPARDHRLRLLFPTGAPVDTFTAASTFDVARRSTTRPPHEGWWHPPPETFPHQGWVSANGLIVVAPGLPEAEVTTDGTIAVTLLRAVGWLSHLELRRRPIPAGPTLVAPDAQCPDGIEARLHLRLSPTGADAEPSIAGLAAADELGLRAVAAGDEALLSEGRSLLAIEPTAVVLSALKPADDGDGFVVRVLNPTDEPLEARLTLDLPVRDVVSVRLDETPDGGELRRDGNRIQVPVAPHALRSVRVAAGR
ncbi:MAG TPA: glycosyl hydrolase-related protein, partial [Acidimicrobiales bacterium]|nr:glycosyl hydrolase-related protein [Acidimicrobiales bacterium]